MELLPEKTKASYMDTIKRTAETTVRIQDLGIAHYEPVFRRVELNTNKLVQKLVSRGAIDALVTIFEGRKKK